MLELFPAKPFVPEQSNTTLEKWRASRNDFNRKTDKKYGITASVFEHNVKLTLYMPFLR